MLWATQNGLISGKPVENGDGILLDPDGNTTRAECATIMMKFDKRVRNVAEDCGGSGNPTGKCLTIVGKLTKIKASDKSDEGTQ